MGSECKGRSELGHDADRMPSTSLRGHYEEIYQIRRCRTKVRARFDLPQCHQLGLRRATASDARILRPFLPTHAAAAFRDNAVLRQRVSVSQSVRIAPTREPWIRRSGIARERNTTALRPGCLWGLPHPDFAPFRHEGHRLADKSIGIACLRIASLRRPLDPTTHPATTLATALEVRMPGPARRPHGPLGSVRRLLAI